MSEDKPTVERRADDGMRAIFEEAYEIIRPFFDEANSWAGRTHEHLAFRTLRERYPALTEVQVYAIVSAGKRVFDEQKRRAF